jgi:hypothetical protein
MSVVVSAAASARPAASSDNARLLQLFWDLSLAEPVARAAAAATLLAALGEQQAAFVAAQPPAHQSACCPNLTYALDRLISGLASSNGSSRQGFAGALVEVCFHILPPAWTCKRTRTHQVV